MTKLIECDKCGKQNIPTNTAYHLSITEIATDLKNTDITVYQIDLCPKCVNELKTYISYKGSY